jgi:hypothetical protein
MSFNIDLAPSSLLCSRGSKLIIWVPPDVRGVLLRPHNTAVFSREGSLHPDFNHAKVGEE